MILINNVPMPVIPRRNRAQHRVQFGIYDNQDKVALEISKLSDDEYLKLFLASAGISLTSTVGELPSGRSYTRNNLLGEQEDELENDELKARLLNSWDSTFVNAIELFYEQQSFVVESWISNAIIKARHRIKGEQVRADRFGPL